MENSDEACSNYLPSSLTSEKQTFRLVEGATLGVEQLLFTENMIDEEKEIRRYSIEEEKL